MKNFSAQIGRIKTKLPKAARADRGLKIFGASSHKYLLSKPAPIEAVISCENTYGIYLPECYKAFVLQVGNGGCSYENSAAGPFYGIYPLGKNLNEFADEEYLKNDCILQPDYSDEQWDKVTSRLENDAISDEEADKEMGQIYGGILPIGSQGCSYFHGLILNGEYRGRVVNLDMGGQKPRFAFEENFLDWYERWLDEIISGDLLASSPSWFGYSMGGTEAELLNVFRVNPDLDTRNEALAGLMRKRTLSRSVLATIDREYQTAKGEIALELLRLLTKYNYPRAKKYLLEVGEHNLLPVFQYIWTYQKGKCRKWVGFIEDHIYRIHDSETFRYCTYLLEESKVDYGSIIATFIHRKNAAIRSQTVYSLGKLKDKKRYLDVFIQGLHDEANKVVHTSLQALCDVTDPKLLAHYKAVAERFSVEEDYILSNLTHRLAEFNLTLEQIRAMDDVQ